MTLREMRKHLRNKLIETGQFVATVPDDYHAEQLRETAYRWGKDNNRIVAVSSKPHEDKIQRNISIEVTGERNAS